jgi:tripartite-type tricarboxylate transporter receptor subunit TctC
MKARLGKAVLLTAGLFAISPHRADAQGAAASRQITIVHGYGVGGTYDQYARLYATHLRKHLDGAPTIIVQSMPGAGGLRMVAYAVGQMASDGTSVIVPPDTIVVSQLLDKGSKFDARAFHYIGAANSENTLWVLRRDAARSIFDLRDKEINTGNSGAGSTGFIVPSFAKGLLNLKVRLISGYQGSKETILAMERREVDGGVFGWGTWETAVPHWFEPGKELAYPVVQVGSVPDPKFPDVPLLNNLVAKQDVAIVNIIDTISVIGRGLALPPGSAPALVDQYRKAFVAMLSNEEFIADATKQRLRLVPASGEDIAKAIKNAIDNATEETIAKARVLADGK